MTCHLCDQPATGSCPRCVRFVCGKHASQTFYGYRCDSCYTNPWLAVLITVLVIGIGTVIFLALGRRE